MWRKQFNDVVTREVTLAGGQKVLEPLAGVLVTTTKINEDGTRAGAPAAIYATRGPTDNTAFALGNPFITPAGGRTGFWTDPGDYDIDFHDNLQGPGSPARFGDYTIGWESTSGQDKGIKASQLPEYGRALAQPGFLAGYAGAGDPPGWLLCDGRILAQAGTYAALYAAIGNIHGLGNEGAGNFRLPDYRGRTLLGADDMGTAQGAAGRIGSVTAGQRTRGWTGGFDVVTLSTPQIPSHGHGLTQAAHGHTINDWGHSHLGRVSVNLVNTDGSLAHMGDLGGGAQDTQVNTTNTTGIQIVGNTISISVDSNGGGQAHTNLPPYAIDNVIIKI